jgi:hypothetical protein
LINDPSDALLDEFERQAREEVMTAALAPVNVIEGAEEELLLIKYQFGEDIIEVRVSGFTKPIDALSALKSAGSTETLIALGLGLIEALEDSDE